MSATARFGVVITGIPLRPVVARKNIGGSGGLYVPLDKYVQILAPERFAVRGCAEDMARMINHGARINLGLVPGRCNAVAVDAVEFAEQKMKSASRAKASKKGEQK